VHTPRRAGIIHPMPESSQHFVEGTRAVIEETSVGREFAELDLLPEDLLLGVEGTFLSEVANRYAPWPSGSTTDGLIPALCTRPQANTLELVGMCLIDFTGERFPLRVRIELSDDLSSLVSFVAEIGEVAEVTGEPPRLPASSMILPQRDDKGGKPDPQLVTGHRVRPIRWRHAFMVTPGEANRSVP
jgi:hypothetical protein